MGVCGLICLSPGDELEGMLAFHEACLKKESLEANQRQLEGLLRQREENKKRNEENERRIRELAAGVGQG